MTNCFMIKFNGKWCGISNVINYLPSQLKFNYLFRFQNILTNEKYKNLLYVGSLLYVMTLINYEQMDMDMFVRVQPASECNQHNQDDTTPAAEMDKWNNIGGLLNNRTRKPQWIFIVYVGKGVFRCFKPFIKIQK